MQICLNARLLLDTVIRCASRKGYNKFISITEYLTDRNVWEIARNEYRAAKCIKGECTECYGTMNPHKCNFVPTDRVMFYQFESITTGKFKADVLIAQEHNTMMLPWINTCG